MKIKIVFCRFPCFFLQLKVVIGGEKVCLLVPPSCSCVHVGRIGLSVVIPVHGDGVSQMLDETFVPET